MPSAPTVVVVPGPIAEITLSRPEALNALNGQIRAELGQALAALAQQDVRALIVTGAGKAFVAGADIAEMRGMSAAEGMAHARAGQALLDQLAAFPAPVLAAVNGFALGGGCELALACDLIYAAEHAKFGLPEVKLGVLPGFGGTVRLPRRIGPGRAAEWIFTGEMVSAADACAAGLVQAVVPGAELLAHVRAVAQTIASRAPAAVRAAKRALAGEGIAAGLAREQALFGELLGGPDAREGMTAFLERRPPQFTGR